ncbi:MAG: sugar-binding protein [Treponema sp.]|nr:sugar-binding protein [Treponema sp.]
MKKVFAIVCLFLCITLFACARENGSVPSKVVGISMPTERLERWNLNGHDMKAQLEKAGYTVDLAFAANEPLVQISQIKMMIDKGCKVLVIAPVDGYALTDVLKAAKEKGIKVISHDRLILKSDAVSYYITFNKYKVGVVQAEFLLDRLNIKKHSKKNPVYMEFFTGDYEDNNVNAYFGGAMDVLKPYIDKGIIVCPSNQTTKWQCSTPGWSTEEAQKRMENLIVTNGYGPKNRRLDAVLCSNDSTAIGVTDALLAAGYSAENMPIITGQDCDIYSIRNIIKGTQSMSVFLDTKDTVSMTVKMVDDIMKGKKPLLNDKQTYNNGSGFMQSYLCDPTIVTKENYKSILIDSGYYTENDLMIINDYSDLIGKCIIVDNNWAEAGYYFKERQKDGYLIEAITFGSGVYIVGTEDFVCKENNGVINIDGSRKFILEDGDLRFFSNGKEQYIVFIEDWEEQGPVSVGRN